MIMKMLHDNSNRNPLPSLQEWQRLTIAETQAIEAGKWDELAQHQAAKDKLQAQMDAEDFSDLAPELEHDLIVRERKNRDLLQEKMDDMQLLLSEENRSMNNIHQVHRAYGHQPLLERQTKPIWHQVT
jgi:hypothetical protein